MVCSRVCLLMLLGVCAAEAARFRSGSPIQPEKFASVTTQKELSAKDKAKMEDMESAMDDMKREESAKEMKDATDRLSSWTDSAEPKGVSARGEDEQPKAAPQPEVNLAGHIDEVADNVVESKFDNLDDQFHKALGPGAEEQKPAAAPVVDAKKALMAKLSAPNKLQEESDQLEAEEARMPTQEALAKEKAREMSAEESTEDLRESMHRFVDHPEEEKKEPKQNTESWRSMADRLSMPTLD